MNVKRTPVEELLKLAIKAAKKSKVEYAIGGALAMRAHGYVRETRDVDLFVVPSHAHRLLLALRGLGLEIKVEMSNTHYTASIPGEYSREQCIDVLLPSEDPNLSAVQWAETMPLMGNKVKVFTIDFLVASKFCSDRPKDEMDLLEMLQLGFFDPVKAEKTIRTMSSMEAKRFRAFILKAVNVKPNKSFLNGGYGKRRRSRQEVGLSRRPG